MKLEVDMNKTLKASLFWVPRVLGIFIVLLLTLISTDVFAEGYTFWQSILGFLIHMLPALAVLVLLIFSWRWEWVGALGFIAFGVWYVAITWSNDMHWSAYAILSVLPILIGILFFVGWVKRGEMRE
jgi:hypothetical protein